MAIKECQVFNANYVRVLAMMDKLLTDRYQQVCGCSRCMSDIAAIALNYLPPHYCVEHGSCGDDHGSPWVMVESAVCEAIDRVLEKPHHSALQSGQGTVVPENSVQR